MEQKELIQSLNKYRKDNDIFKRSIEERSPKFTSITYDGPPFASGTPHFGHGITSSMKDAILRYKTMKGYRVNRDRWWDCHGLPVEKAVEKHLGIDGRKDIEEKIWIQKFVEECRNYVSNTSNERRTFVDQLGRRADMDHAYYTMDLSFMESTLRAFQTMYNQNLVYKGFKVQRYCPSCATTLANNEVNEGYKDRQDPAITIKFKVKSWKSQSEDDDEVSNDGFVHTTRALIKNEKGEYLVLFDPRRSGLRSLPWGRVKKWETAEQAVTREVAEELWVQVVSASYLWARKLISTNKYNLLSHYFEIVISWTPKIQETNNHVKLEYAEIIHDENSLWFAVKIENTIISDEHELLEHFNVFHTIKNVLPHLKDLWAEMKTADVNVLAWTTTPWTLPSNMFAAVGSQIHYVMLFDKSSKEYYILAENLIKQFYKDANEYILINIVKGKELEWTTYEPLFPYINQSKIPQHYKDQFFRIITGEFVSTEDGTGIVHIAPSFGVEDFEAVAQFLPREEAKKRLFLPVNEYGEFTDEVPDWKWMRVYDANKDIIQKLKDEKKLIGQRSYNHSYPHCRRCDAPLVSKAVTSRFIKEPKLQPLTVPHAQDIGFIPEAIKNRFVDVLQTAPDWNLSRNRYRGSPLPIREVVQSPKSIKSIKSDEKTFNLMTWWPSTLQIDDDDRIVVGTLEELFQNTKTWSNNITKNIIVRHGRTDYNETWISDSYSHAKLSAHGQRQAKTISKQILALKKDNLVIVVSPLGRTFETILPYLEKRYGDQVPALQKKYEEIQKIYQDLRNKKEIQHYIQKTDTQKLFEIHEKIRADFRITDVIVPELQDKVWIPHLTTSRPMNEKLTPEGECMNDIQARISSYVHEVNTKFAGKTIVTVTHEDSYIFIRKTFKDFDYLHKKHDYEPKNGNIYICYRDNDRNTEVDLHKPYIDNYRFKKWVKEYRRIPEVMDCRFESGAMPFGQCNYLGTRNSKLGTEGKKPLVYPADFIIEGLDQTRGRFRTLHVVGNAVMGKNSFNNVIINWMVLAEDGKKMSKKMKNYPDPDYLFNKYGSDAYRLYMLSSPGVRAEPVKFSEKGVDQIYKDFTTAILNAYKFFETYAKVDNFSYNKPTTYFLRHGESEWMDAESKLTAQVKEDMQKNEFIEKALRMHPDIIYSSPFTRAKQTAKIIQLIIKDHLGKKVKIKIDDNLGIVETAHGASNAYQKIIKKEAWKNVLLVSHIPQFEDIWNGYYPGNKWTKIGRWECIKLPSYKITNELDKRILAELNNLGIELELQMDKYVLDNAAKLVLGFIDKLNNRYIRRSRRRFRASGMDEDKTSAYNTMFEVLENYMKIAAPFAPFITEHIYLELQKFKHDPLDAIRDSKSVHLEHLPLPSIHYINKDLLSEIETVRRIISLGLFIRSKNRIAVKQPLAKIELKIDG